MRTTPQNVINCLAGDLLVDPYLILDVIKSDEEILGIFRDTVEDFTEYQNLVSVFEGQF